MKMLGALVVLAWVGGVTGQIWQGSDECSASYDKLMEHRNYYISENEDVRISEIIQLIKEYKERYGNIATITSCNETFTQTSNITILANNSIVGFDLNEDGDNVVTYETKSPSIHKPLDNFYTLLGPFTSCPCNVTENCNGDSILIASVTCPGCPSGDCTAWSWAAPDPPSDDDNNGDVVWIVVGSVGGALVLAGVGFWIYQNSKPQGHIIKPILNLDVPPGHIYHHAPRFAPMNPNALYENGDHAIHIAAASGIFQLVAWLVDRGADIWVTNAHNETPRDVAHRKGHTSIVRYLEKKSVDHVKEFYKRYLIDNPETLIDIGELSIEGDN